MKQSEVILSIAVEAHGRMRINPVEAQKVISTGLAQIGQIRTNTQQQDLVTFCGQVENYLEGMQRHGTYYSAFAASLDTLSRQAELVREEGR